MYSTEVTYFDYGGKERKEKLNFELDIKDIFALELVLPGGMSDFIDRLSKTENHVDVLMFIKAIVLSSYGKLSRDKKKFDKSVKAKEKFVDSKPYNVFMMSLMKDPKKFGEFLNNVFPMELKKEFEEYEKNVNNDNKDVSEIKLNNKTIFDDMSELGFKLKGEE